MLLIKIALYYREGRLCRGKWRLDGCCHLAARRSLSYFGWKQLGLGYFGGKPSPAGTRGAHPVLLTRTARLTYPDPSALRRDPMNYLGPQQLNRDFWGQHGSTLHTISDFWMLFIPLRNCIFCKSRWRSSVAATPKISPPSSASAGPALAQGPATAGTSTLSHRVSRQPLSHAQPKPPRDGCVLQPGDISRPRFLRGW